MTLRQGRGAGQGRGGGRQAGAQREGQAGCRRSRGIGPWPIPPPRNCLHLYIGTLRYRSAVTPDTTYSHQKKARGAACNRNTDSSGRVERGGGALWPAAAAAACSISPCAHPQPSRAHTAPGKQPFHLACAAAVERAKLHLAGRPQPVHEDQGHQDLHQRDCAWVVEVVDGEDGSVEERDGHRDKAILEACYEALEQAGRRAAAARSQSRLLEAAGRRAVQHLDVAILSARAGVYDRHLGSCRRPANDNSSGHGVWA